MNPESVREEVEAIRARVQFPPSFGDAPLLRAIEDRAALLDLLDEAVEMVASLRQPHTYVEDCWYSCPKAPDGCCDDAQGDECNCGADSVNARINAFLARFDAEGTDG